MVLEYLERSRQEMLEKQIALGERVQSLQNSLKENIKFIQMLEESSDPNYAAFTPREVNGHNDEKIKELKEEQQLISTKLQEEQKQISDLKLKILEINSVIKVLKERIESDNDSGTGLERLEDYSISSRLMILETQEKERQRIARDLHDSTVQNLTSLVHKAELCMKLMDVDPIRCRLELSTLGKTLRSIIDDTRTMIYDLRPMSFDDIGFDVTVERFLDKLKSNTVGVKISYEICGEPYPFNSVIAITLLRIIQEGCSNAVKHANADHIKVQLSYLQNELQLLISDDGDGFDPESLPKESRDDNSGFGMSMMRERVFLLSGTVDVQSKIGEGCTIKVNIPIKVEEK